MFAVSSSSVKRTLGSVGLFILLACACGRSNNLASKLVKDPAPQTTASLADSCEASRVLAANWEAPVRDALDGALRAASGPVIVRYEACELTVLPDCTAPGSPYAFIGLNPKTERVTMTTADQLFAKLPVRGRSLEGRLGGSTSINIELATVGMVEAEPMVVAASALAGSCDGATHLVGSAQVGAYAMWVERQQGGSVVDSESGVGLGRSGEREDLETVGEMQACSTSASDDAAPPGCGSLLRLELFPLD